MQILKYKCYESSAELDVENWMCSGKFLFVSDLITYEALIREAAKRICGGAGGLLRHLQEAGILATNMDGIFVFRRKR